MSTISIPLMRAAVTMGLFGALATTTGAAAQSGGGWTALLGCWRASPMEALEPGMTPEDRMICILPAADAREVEFVTFADGMLESREMVDASGVETAFDRDGCLGTESARISDDGRRIYQESRYSCPGPFSRTTSGIFSMLPSGEWLSVQGVAAGEYAEIQVVRHRRVSDLASLDPAIADALAGRQTAIRAAGVAAGAPLSLAEVIEVSRETHPSVVEAWLIEYGQGFRLTATDLVALDEAGVPEGVIDLVVALSNPRVFAIDLSSRQGEFRPEEAGFDAPRPRGGYYDPWYDRYGRWGRYDPWGYGYGGYYYYPSRNPPVIIIQDPGDGESPSRTRLVRGRGYTRSTGTTAGGAESGSSGGSRSSEPSSSAGSSRPSSTASPSSGATSRPSAGGSSSSGGSSEPAPTRTARPRPR